MDIDTIKNILKENGYKLTIQRKVIIEVLFEHKGSFLTAEEIYNKTKEKHPEINFSTVYRNLSIFEFTNIVYKTSIDKGISIYELYSNYEHHHIICKACGRTEEIKLSHLKEMFNKIDTKNFILIGHKFELYGYCVDCKNNNNLK